MTVQASLDHHHIDHRDRRHAQRDAADLGGMQVPPQDEPAEPECRQEGRREGDRADGHARLGGARATGSISAPARTWHQRADANREGRPVWDVLLDTEDVPGQGLGHDFDQRSGHGDQMRSIEASRAMPSQMAAT
jgi:hypothetical protein